jgi:hypothetical protein
VLYPITAVLTIHSVCCHTCHAFSLLVAQLDAQQTYKQALAFWATGNVTYAENALRISHAWASNNQVQAAAEAAAAAAVAAAATAVQQD